MVILKNIMYFVFMFRWPAFFTASIVPLQIFRFLFRQDKTELYLTSSTPGGAKTKTQDRFPLSST